MSDRNHFLVSFENVSASVGGYDISSIVELHLSATANDIPQITLLVDAGHSEGGEPQAVSPVSLDNARQIFETCRGMVKKDGSTLSLSLTCRADGPGGSDTQNLNISGWLLTDVSLSPIQEGGVCTVALTFMHPLCKAHFGGVVPGLLAKPPDLSSLSGSNPLEVFVSALEIYGEEAQRVQPREASVPGASDAADVRDRLLQHLAKATESLNASVSWSSGGGLPAESQLASWGDLLRMGLTCYALPSGGTSVFQRFAKMMLPECSLALGGDYTQEQLSVGPLEPWAEASLTIRERDIVSLQFPQSDPSPISGVQVQSSNTADGSPLSYHVDSCQTEETPSEIYYVPESELAADYLYGPIQQFQEPGWLGHMSYYEQCQSDGDLSDALGAQDGSLQIAVSTPRGGNPTFGGGGGGDGSPAVDYSEALLACAKAYYETSLMKDWSFTVNCRLLFDASGGRLCPGKVLSVQSDSGDVLSGYVISVTHAISVVNRSAVTSVVCTHPRIGAPPESITSTSNALYS